MSILADRVLAIVDEVERRGLAAIDAGPAGIPDERPLQQPLLEEFRVGTLVIAWDDDIDRLIVEARSMTFDAGAGESAMREGDEPDEDDIPDDAPIGPDVLRVRLTPSWPSSSRAAPTVSWPAASRCAPSAAGSCSALATSATATSRTSSTNRRHDCTEVEAVEAATRFPRDGTTRRMEHRARRMLPLLGKERHVFPSGGKSRCIPSLGGA